MFATLDTYYSFEHNRLKKENFRDLDFDLGKRYKDFIHNPVPSYETNPIRTYSLFSSKKTPHLTIIMPVYNQQDLIKQNATSIFTCTQGTSYEVIFIVDCCSDDTESVLRNTLQELNMEHYKQCTEVRMLVSDTPLFETSADNLGLYCSQGTYAIEIQADMEMTEPGYNQILLKPFAHDSSIIGISGRCTHGFKTNEGIGKLGALVEQKLSPDIDRNAYYIGETCNRGPLALDLKKVKELGYLDEVNFFLDDSDHDLFARAYSQKQWICGYSPIEFNTSLQNGSTRKPRDPLNQKIYEYKKRETSKRNGFLYSYVDALRTNRPIKKINY